MLEIDNSKVDLSRRQTVYVMSGLSFREYLAFEGVIFLAPFSLDDLVSRHVATAWR